ncbi:PrpF domain-containing protein [Streptomyces marispadix]|uniref:PrpF protein n=1 Tax=Streptomyces marispadix TaxID=2922868 RepID=A0ABS9T5I8_9ACTN|nr:PrpF domain-containing protein [Streptomyces marispadix]MCH6163820.1 PrpF protein [Streptomyces marispadix]
MSGGVPAVLMRGGTSKGVFLHARDVPPPGPRRDALVLDLMGSPDPMQIDGLGGTYSSTSKVMIVEPGPDSGVSYWFGQVGVDSPTVDWSGNCGNLTTAVAAFAVDEGLVPAVSPVTSVLLFNRNTDVWVEAEVPVENGRVRTHGTQRVAGVPRPGAPIATHYQDPAGSVTGRLLPTGRGLDVLDLPEGRLRVSVVDAASAFVFALAADLDVVTRARTVAQMNADEQLLERIESVRGAAARLMGSVERAEDAARLSPAVPRIVLVAPGGDVAVADLDVVAVSMGAVHRALPMTAALCLAAAARIPGTVVNAAARTDGCGKALRIAHPLGEVEAVSDVDSPADDAPAIRSVGVVRTARRLMKGTVYPFDEELTAADAEAEFE